MAHVTLKKENGEGIISKNAIPAYITDTPGLQGMTQSGRHIAIQIGEAAGAKIKVGSRVFWNVKKVQEYLDSISQ